MVYYETSSKKNMGVKEAMSAIFEETIKFKSNGENKGIDNRQSINIK